MITTDKLTILYDALREGKVKVDIISPLQREKHGNIVSLVNDEYLKHVPSKGFHETYKLTPKGRKYILNYDKEMRGDYGKSTVLTGKF